MKAPSETSGAVVALHVFGELVAALLAGLREGRGHDRRGRTHQRQRRCGSQGAGFLGDGDSVRIVEAAATPATTP